MLSALIQYREGCCFFNSRRPSSFHISIFFWGFGEHSRDLWFCTELMSLSATLCQIKKIITATDEKFTGDKCTWIMIITMHFYSGMFRLVLYKHAFLKRQLPVEWQCLNPEGGNVRTQISRRPARGASPTQPQSFLYLLESHSGFCEHHSKQDRVVLKKHMGLSHTHKTFQTETNTLCLFAVQLCSSQAVLLPGLPEEIEQAASWCVLGVAPLTFSSRASVSHTACWVCIARNLKHLYHIAGFER